MADTRLTIVWHSLFTMRPDWEAALGHAIDSTYGATHLISFEHATPESDVDLCLLSYPASRHTDLMMSDQLTQFCEDFPKSVRNQVALLGCELASPPIAADDVQRLADDTVSNFAKQTYGLRVAEFDDLGDSVAPLLYSAARTSPLWQALSAGPPPTIEDPEAEGDDWWTTNGHI